MNCQELPTRRGQHQFLLAITATCCCCSAPTPATPTPIKPPNATLDAEFSLAGSVRELSDGRVIIADEKENRLVVTDTAFSTVPGIGHRGDGPAEFHAVARIWPIGSDSSLINDQNVHRWTLLSGAQTVATVPPDDPAMRAFTSGFGLVTGAGGGGILVGWIARRESRSMSDSLLLIRVDRATGRADTLTRLYIGPEDGSGADAGGGRGSGKRQYVVSIQGIDEAVAFADGWVAVARADPYRVDWCAPRSRCTPGSRLEPTVPMTTARKRAYLAMANKTGRWPHTTDPAETIGWPAFVPPYEAPAVGYGASALTPLPDGSLLIARMPTAEDLRIRYDIVTREGVIARRVVLPVAQRIIGVGAHSAYVVTTAEDGIQHLSRHPWP